MTRAVETLPTEPINDRPPMWPMHEQYLCIPEDLRPVFREWRDVSAYTSLRDSGEQYVTQLDSIMGSDEPLKMDYVRSIGDMYLKAHTAALAFPPRYQEGVRRGMRDLLADSLYAVDAHIRNGRQTDARLPLNSGSELELKMVGDEPHQLLTVLQGAIDVVSMVRAFGYGERAAVPAENIKVTTPKNYAMYRFVNPSPYTPHQILPVSLYVRPYGYTSYNPRLEYGKSGEGVEASISFVIDTQLTPRKLMEVGKHGNHGDDSRISIRLDREGIKLSDRMAGGKKNPTQQEGTLSLDVGSVLGRDEWTSTKIGRLLAWGNVLRTRAQGVETYLNHMTEYFDSEDGDADVFALQAARLIERLDNNSVDATELKKLFTGRLALNGARQ